jgi:hypothetical protein
MRSHLMKPSRRRAQGQALLEGVIALAIIIFGTVIAGLFLVNAGLSLYFKEKLGFIANQAAQFAFQIEPPEDPTARTQQFVRELVTQLALPASNVQVTATRGLTGGVNSTTVRINLGMRLFGRGDVLPFSIPMNETSVAIATNYIVRGPAGATGPAGPAGAAAPQTTISAANPQNGFLEVPVNSSGVGGRKTLMVPIARVIPRDQNYAPEELNAERFLLLDSQHQGAGGAALTFPVQAGSLAPGVTVGGTGYPFAGSGAP